MNSLPPPPSGSAPLPPPNATTADPLELTLSRKQTWLQRYWALPVVLALGVAAIVAILIADTTGNDKSATGTTSSVAQGETIPTTPAVTNADTTVVTVPATSVAQVPETTAAAPVTTAAPDTTVAPTAPPATVAPIAPVQLVGKLKGVVDVSGHTPSMMTITCNGSRAFVVTALDTNGRTVDVLIDKVGKYSGTVAVLDPSVTSLQIESSGNWTIDVADLSSAAHVSGANSGTGDGVFIRDDAAAGSVRVTHSGRGAFSVKTGTGVVVAEGTGAFDATVPVPGGPVVLVVRADGAWSIA